jgi:hypothetical protein
VRVTATALYWHNCRDPEELRAMNKPHPLAPALAITNALALLLATPQAASAMTATAAEPAVEVPAETEAAAAEASPAPQDPVQEQATEHFHKGSLHFQLRQYPEAEVEIKEAYRLTQSPELLSPGAHRAAALRTRHPYTRNR